MKMSVNSWHFRIYNYVNGYPSHISLCKYFWSAIGSTLILPLVALWRLFSVDTQDKITLSICIGVLVAFNIAWAWFNWLALLSVYGGIGAMLGIIYGVNWLKNKFYHPKPKPPKAKKPKTVKAKHPNIVLEYLKARKRKVCPIIEWTCE